jgi:cobaltochelatase CobS
MMVAGRRYITVTGRGFTLIRRFKKQGAKTRLVQMGEIKWDNDEQTFEITRRMFNKMVTRVATPGQDDVKPDVADTTPDVAPATPVPSLNSDLAQAIAAAVAPHVRAGIDRDQIEAIVDARIVDSLLPRRIEVVVPGTGDMKDVGVQHTYFEAIRRLAIQRLNIWLNGPAGGGKTTIAASIADSLGLPHYAQSVCALTSKADLIGYKNVTDGNYVATDLRKAYEEGGVFLLDECDAGNANVMVIMNALLANGRCAFPDGMVDKHPDFIMIAGANTVGLGADKQYVGRNQLDKATLDRFVMLEFPYDPTIEACMAGVSPSCFAEADRPEPIEFIQVDDKADSENDARLKSAAEVRCAEFCRRIVRIRKAMDELKVRHIVSPRATKAGCTMIRLGFTMADTMKMAVWKGLDADTVSKVESRI